MEPKDKNSQEWREWYLRRKKFNPELLRIAVLRSGLDLQILREYLSDLEGELSPKGRQ